MNRKADAFIEVLPVNWKLSHSKDRNHCGITNGKTLVIWWPFLLELCFKKSHSFNCQGDGMNVIKIVMISEVGPFPSNNWISQRNTPRVNISCCSMNSTKHLQRLLKVCSKVLDEIAMYSVEIHSVGWRPKE